MVVRGFSWNTPRNEVVETMNKMVKFAGKEMANALDCPPFTIAKMTSFGIVRFKDTTMKNKFKEWLAADENKEYLKNMKVWMNDNQAKERRVMETVAGKVKCALCQNREGREDVTCDWRWGRVYVGRELVAKWENEI